MLSLCFQSGDKCSITDRRRLYRSFGSGSVPRWDRILMRSSPVRADKDRKSTRLNSSHLVISYAVFCLKKKTKQHNCLQRAVHSHPADAELPCVHPRTAVETRYVSVLYVLDALLHALLARACTRHSSH